MEYQNVKIVVFVPETHSDAVREEVGKAGAGEIGNYTFCSFSTKGLGRFKPEQGASPHIGEIGKFEQVTEERIEFNCPKEKLNEVVMTIRKVHPYDEVAFDVYPLVDL